MYIVDFWTGVAKESFPEKRKTELNHERKIEAVRSIGLEKRQTGWHFR